MDGAGCDEHMNPMMFGSLNRGMDFFDVLCIAAGQTADDRPRVLLGNRLNGFKITG